MNNLESNVFESRCFTAIIRKCKYAEEANLRKKNIREYTRISFYPHTEKWNITFCVETRSGVEFQSFCNSALN